MATKINEPRTYIVTGLIKGGTSVVAALLELMGIPMGRGIEKFDDDNTLRQLLSVKDYRALIKSRVKTWGFKYPGIGAEQLRIIEERVNNPHFVLVFRDPMAVTMHDGRDKTNRCGRLLYVKSQYLLELSGFIRSAQSPIAVISYEKLLINKEEEIIKLARFCEIEIDEKVLHECVDFIIPEDKYRRIGVLNGG